MPVLETYNTIIAFTRIHQDLFRILDDKIFSDLTPGRLHPEKVITHALAVLREAGYFERDAHYNDLPESAIGVMSLNDFQMKSPLFKHFVLAAFLRYAPNILNIDPDTYKELISSEVKKVPLAVLKELPYTSFMFALSEPMNFEYRASYMTCTAVHVGVSAGNLALFTFIQPDGDATSIWLDVEGEELLDLQDRNTALIALREESIKTMIANGGQLSDENTLDAYLIDDFNQPIIQIAWKITLFLASKNRDIAGKSVTVAQTKTKRGMKFFPLATPNILEVGYRIGKGLRDFKKYKAEVLSAHALGGKMSPHMRRAHYRNQPYGPRDKPTHWDLIWVSECFINKELIEQMQAVVQPV